MQQWLRKCNLLLVDESGEGMDLSDFHITFSISKEDISAPNSAEINVYNLSTTTMTKLEKEFSAVVLQAGYENNFGVIFKGDIWQYRKSKENGKDVILKIIAGDGEKGFNFATINQTIGSGSSPTDQYQAVLTQILPNNVVEGHVDQLPKDQLPRGKPMFGLCKKYLNDLSVTTQTSWSIQDGQLNVIKDGGYLPDEAVELTSQTGLIGRPEQTMEGLMVTCLINPRLKVGSRIHVNEASFEKLAVGTGYGDSVNIDIAPKVTADGFYRILGIDYVGDNRGADWYCKIMCVGIDESAPVGTKVIDSGAGASWRKNG